MKFARYIQGLEHDCPPEWAGKFLRWVRICAGICFVDEMGSVRRPSPNPQLRNVSYRYKELKKLLKPLSSEQSQEVGGPEAGEQALGPAAEHDEEVFFSTLRAQMKVVDR